MSLAALDEKAHSYSWCDNSEAWQSWEADNCSACHALLVLNAGGERQHSDEADSACPGRVNAEGPMMNYYYPVPHLDYALRTRLGGVEGAAKAIADLPLALVEFLDDNLDDDEKHALALTGGGMDLAWEICEAYMRLGYLPPVEFKPAVMSGRGTSPRDQWVLAGCRRARTALIEVMQRRLESLDRDFPPPAAWKIGKKRSSRFARRSARR
jgi:hypothetical protein